MQHLAFLGLIALFLAGCTPPEADDLANPPEAPGQPSDQDTREGDDGADPPTGGDPGDEPPGDPNNHPPTDPPDVPPDDPGGTPDPGDEPPPQGVISGAFEGTLTTTISIIAPPGQSPSAPPQPGPLSVHLAFGTNGFPTERHILLLADPILQDAIQDGLDPFAAGQSVTIETYAAGGSRSRGNPGGTVTVTVTVLEAVAGADRFRLVYEFRQERVADEPYTDGVITFEGFISGDGMRFIIKRDFTVFEPAAGTAQVTEEMTGLLQRSTGRSTGR
jgi:hypothetical protein